jgi:hypothetical protein
VARGDPADFRGTPASCDPNIPAAQCLEWHIRPHLVKAEVYKGDPDKGFGYGYSARCPAHDDAHSSFTANVGLHAIWYQCHAVPPCDQLAIRFVLIGRGVPPPCLSVSKERSAHLVDRLAGLLTSGAVEDGHKVLLALAYVRGMAGLPRGNALEALAADTSTVSRPSACRYRREGFQPTSGSYSPNPDQVKQQRSGPQSARPETSHGEMSSQGERSEQPSEAAKRLMVRPRKPAA